MEEEFSYPKPKRLHSFSWHQGLESFNVDRVSGDGQELGWLGGMCVCAFWWSGEGGGCTLSRICVLYVCVALFTSSELISIISLSTIFICGFHRMVRESETSEATERWKEREIESAREFAKSMTVDAQ